MKTLLLLLLSTSCLAQLKISDMPTAENIDKAWIPIIQDGINKRASANLFIRTDTVLVVRYIVVIDHQYENPPYTIKWNHKEMKIDTIKSVPLLKGKKVEVYDISGTVVRHSQQGRNVKQ